MKKLLEIIISLLVTVATFAILHVLQRFGFLNLDSMPYAVYLPVGFAIITGLILSTVLIVAIAVFAIFNIQKKLNIGYQNFGQVISKTLAIESNELTKNLPANEIYNTLKTHTDTILKSHNDIVFIEFTDKDGKIIYSGKNDSHKSTQKPNITVSSPLTDMP